MLGFLSTFIPASARPGLGAAADGAGKSSEPSKAFKAVKEADSSDFQAAFAKANVTRPAVADAPQQRAAGGGPPQGESDSAVQDDLEVDESDDLDFPHPGHEEASVDATQASQLDFGLEPALSIATQGETSGVAVLPAGGDAGDDSGLMLDVSQTTTLNPGSSSAEMGRVVYGSASQPALPQHDQSVSSPQAVLVSNADVTRSMPAMRAVDVAPVENAAMHPVELDATTTALPGSARDSRTNAGEITAPGGAISSLSAGARTSGESRSSDRYGTANDTSKRAAMAMAPDMMRNAASAQPNPEVPAFAAELDLAGGEEGGRSAIILNDPAVSGDPRPAPTTTAELRMSTVAGGGAPQMARHIAIQLSEAAGKAADRPLDLTLNPSELGRVRITLTPGDGGMVVNLSAERQDTLDLLRRHIDMLDQEFHDLGYGGTDFTFSREGSGARHGGLEQSGNAPHADDVSHSGAASIVSQSALSVTTDRLDIRL